MCLCFCPPSLSEIKKERPPTPDDVIVLSDNEPSSPLMNGVSHGVKKTDTDMLMVSSLAAAVDSGPAHSDSCLSEREQ